MEFNEERNLLISAYGIGAVRVVDYDEEGCCKREGERPEGFELCCDGMPEEYVPPVEGGLRRINYFYYFFEIIR